MRLYKIFVVLLIGLLFSAVNIEASRPIVKMKLDSTVIIMGKLAHMEVSVDQQRGTKGTFPIFAKASETGRVSVCGDSVEYVVPSKADTSYSGGMEKILFTVPIQSFDSGYYQLPELIYVVGNDSIGSNRPVLKVVPVNFTEKDMIDDYANVSDPENQSIFDHVPDWIINYWWIILILLALTTILLYLYKRYKKEGSILPKKPEPTPYQVAISSLRELKAKKLWEQGLEKDYFTDLTDILRIYLYKRFGINAMEMTSREILASLKENDETRDKRQYFRQILGMADFVKFAKVRPLPEDNELAFDNAMKFVRETKPQELTPEQTAQQKRGQKKIKANHRKPKGGKL